MSRIPLESTASTDAVSTADLQSLTRRMEQLDEEVRELRSHGAAARETAYVADAPKKPEEKPPENEGYVVGSDLSVKPEFRNGLFLWFATPNNDFTMHLGRLGAAR